MSDMVPEILNAALDSLFTPKEPGEREYQGEDGLLYCRSCHTPVQCRVKLWGRDKIVPCLCRCQQEAMAEKKRQDELVERQRKIRQLAFCYGEMSEPESPLWRHVLPMRCWSRAFRF